MSAAHGAFYLECRQRTHGVETHDDKVLEATWLGRRRASTPLASTLGRHGLLQHEMLAHISATPSSVKCTVSSATTCLP